MGKQIRFFATPTDLKRFWADTLQNGLVAIDCYGDLLKFEQINALIERDFRGDCFGVSNCYITRDGLDLYYFPNKRLDVLKSEVIQFSACTQSPEKKVDLSSVTSRFSKGGIIVIDKSNETEYNRQLSELMENPTYIRNPNHVPNGYEHGRLWFSPDYYDDNGQKMWKSDELSKIYSALVRRIRRTFKPSKAHYGYIGENAYQMYLEGKLIPCSGKNLIDF